MQPPRGGEYLGTRLRCTPNPYYIYIYHINLFIYIYIYLSLPKLIPVGIIFDLCQGEESLLVIDTPRRPLRFFSFAATEHVINQWENRLKQVNSISTAGLSGAVRFRSNSSSSPEVEVDLKHWPDQVTVRRCFNCWFQRVRV